PRGGTEAACRGARSAVAGGCRRCEWKGDDDTGPAKRAAERFGFTCEGVFRQHLVVKGRNRDTAWLSIIDTEWPALRAAHLEWLDEANFDSAGRQQIGRAHV